MTSEYFETSSISFKDLVELKRKLGPAPPNYQWVLTGYSDGVPPIVVRVPEWVIAQIAEQLRKQITLGEEAAQND